MEALTVWCLFDYEDLLGIYATEALARTEQARRLEKCRKQNFWKESYKVKFQVYEETVIGAK